MVCVPHLESAREISGAWWCAGGMGYGLSLSARRAVTKTTALRCTRSDRAAQKVTWMSCAHWTRRLELIALHPDGLYAPASVAEFTLMNHCPASRTLILRAWNLVRDSRLLGMENSSRAKPRFNPHLQPSLAVNPRAFWHYFCSALAENSVHQKTFRGTSGRRVSSNGGSTFCHYPVFSVRAHAKNAERDQPRSNGRRCHHNWIFDRTHQPQPYGPQ